MEEYETKVVSVEEAVGMVAAEMVIPYPPGIPLIMYGESITSEHKEQIMHLESWRSFSRQHEIYESV